MNSILTSIKKIGTFPCLIILGFFLDPFNVGHLFGYILLGFFVIYKELLKSLLDFDVFLLFLFSLVYALFYSFNPEKGTQYILIYLIFPASFYLFGKYITKSVSNYKELFYVLVVLGVVFSLLGLLSTGYDILTNGFVQTKRNVSKIWGGNRINATGMAAYLFANMCIPAIIMFGFNRRKLWFNALIGVIYILTFICVLRLGSRTQLGISLITLIISLVYKMSSMSAVKNIALIGVLFIGVNLGFSYISLDKDSDLLASYATRMDSKKYGAATAGGRTERWEKSIINLVEEPLGWPVEQFGFSHNMWLDAARIGGTIGFILLLLFSIKSVLKTKKILMYKFVDREFKNVALLYSIAFLLQFFVEPTLDGSFNLFVFFCLFQGVLNMGVAYADKGHSLQ